VWHRGQSHYRTTFFEETLNVEVYTDFLKNILLQLLENVPLDLRINMWMQHDEYQLILQEFLDLKCKRFFFRNG